MGCAAKALASVPGASDSWRLTSPEKLHLTLAFLGEVEESFARGFADAVGRAAPAGLAGPGLTIEAPGKLAVLGGGGALAVLVQARGPALQLLHQRVQEVLAADGRGTAPRPVAEEPREVSQEHAEGEDPGQFRPHLTLARRVRDRNGDGKIPSNLGLSSNLDWTSTALTVTFSTLRTAGSFYEPAGSLSLPVPPHPPRPRRQP